MKSVIVFLAPGFEEIEAVTVIDVLRRAGVEVTVAGTETGNVTGSHDITLETDTTVDAVQAGPFDMAVLPGGMPGTLNLDRDPRVVAFLKEMQRGRKIHLRHLCSPRCTEDRGCPGWQGGDQPPCHAGGTR